MLVMQPCDAEGVSGGGAEDCGGGGVGDCGEEFDAGGDWGILAGEEKDKDGNPSAGTGAGGVPRITARGRLATEWEGHLYCEADKSWCRWALLAWCLQYVIQKPGYKILAHHPFRDDITDCVDGDEVVAKVKRDPRGIGFFQYRPGMPPLLGCMWCRFRRGKASRRWRLRRGIGCRRGRAGMRSALREQRPPVGIIRWPSRFCCICIPRRAAGEGVLRICGGEAGGGDRG